MTNSTKISVLVCTYNRSRTLGETIQSIAAQTLDQSLGWEILIVDNNSNDDTRQVVEDFQRWHPELIRYIFEPQQGLSYARNRGIREARGEILVFIDDDETAEANWVQNLTANLHSGEWAGAGGRVLLPLDFTLPNWLPPGNLRTSAPLSVFDKGPEPAGLNEPPFGANMAFRKEVFDRYGGFRTDLGRSGNNMISNEDTEFGRRLLAVGLRLRYEPSALTYHRVEESRRHPEYFLKWWFNKGRSDVRESRHQGTKVRLLGIPLRLFRDLALESVRWTLAVQPAQRFSCKLGIWAYAGEVLESYLQWLNSRRNGLNQRGIERH